jgi:hypothetical protein
MPKVDYSSLKDFQPCLEQAPFSRWKGSARREDVMSKSPGYVRVRLSQISIQALRLAKAIDCNIDFRFRVESSGGSTEKYVHSKRASLVIPVNSFNGVEASLFRNIVFS